MNRLASGLREPTLRKLEWRVRHAADAALAGEYRTAFRGRGREFDQVVRYEWGDDVRDIDWNVTARLGEPYRKKFVEERELTVVLLVEDTPSLQFGSGARSKREALLEMVGLFALLAAGNRDRVGFWHATPTGETVHRPRRGRGRIVRSAAELLGTPAVPLLETTPDVAIDWKRLAHVFPRHSILLWCGDHAPRLMPDAWRVLKQRFEVVGVRVDDPWERVLPDLGRIAAVDPTSGEMLPFDPRSRATRLRHTRWREAREAAFDELFPSPLQRLVFTTEDDGLDALVRFFRTRMKRMAA